MKVTGQDPTDSFDASVSSVHSQSVRALPNAKTCGEVKAQTIAGLPPSIQTSRFIRLIG